MLSLQLGLARLWALEGVAEQVSHDWPGHATGEAVVLFWRARWVMLVVGAIGFAISTIGLVMALAQSRSGSGTLFLTGVAILSAQQATVQAFRLWLLFKLGGWSRKIGGPVRRAEQPLKFWAWAITSACIVILHGGLAAFLVWGASSWHS